MEVFEINGFKTGVNKSGVTFLQPADSFQKIQNGFIHRQELQSRKGIGFFAPQLADANRIMGIFEFVHPNGTKELLVFDTNFLYSYNSGTNTFNKITFAGSLAAYAGFNITDNSAYISGTAYPTKTNSARFVFSSEGIATSAFGSAIFYYNGSNVYDYTNPADNTDYSAPLSGKLVRARNVVFFNERINFIAPTILTEKNQTILFSGIKNSAGNGDKFNVVGSGEITFSTQDKIAGAIDQGQSLCVLLSNSTKFLDITTDPFNPYRIRNVSSVIGTDAPFSKVSFDEDVFSIGRDGIIKTDGNSSLRIDNKIPNFSRNEIDQKQFELTYGGYNKEYSQFWWSYKEDNLNDTSTQDHVLVRSYEEGSWSTYDLRITTFGYTEIGNDLAWDDISEAIGDPSWARWDTTEDLWNKIGLGDEIKKTLAGNDKGVIFELNKDFDDYSTGISSISNASNAVIGVSYHSFSVGDLVVIQNAEGMTEINNFDPEVGEPENIIYYNVVAVTDTEITINADSSLFGTHTAGTGIISKPISFYCETIPFNPYREKGNRIYISEIEVMVDSIGGFLKVDVYENEQDSPFIRDVLLKPSRTDQKREFISMAINHEANFITFAFKQISPSTGVKIPTVRIHSEEGGEIYA